MLARGKLLKSTRLLFPLLVFLGVVVWIVSILESLQQTSASLQAFELPRRPADRRTAVSVKDREEALSVDANLESVPPTVILREPDRAAAPYYRMYFGGYLVEEVSREENVSFIESEVEIDSWLTALERWDFPGDVLSQATFIAHSPVLMELACLRSFHYYFVLAEQDRDTFLIFFTNDEHRSISDVLGENYSARARRHFDVVGYSKTPFVTDLGSHHCIGRLYTRREPPQGY